MAKPNYQYEKRQRDLAKKQKQEEKRRQKIANKAAGEPEQPSANDTDEGVDQTADGGGTSEA